MHDSVMAFGKRTIVTADIAGKRVIEVGSMNVNGSLRPHVESFGPSCYIGVDFAPGRGVDVVCDAVDLERRFGAEAFDVVISTEMLEHAENWRAVITAMKRVLVPGGLIVLTARGPGFKRHSYPNDWHRFTLNDMRRIFVDFQIEDLRSDDVLSPGVMLRGRKPLQWQEADLGQIKVAPADERNAPRI